MNDPDFMRADPVSLWMKLKRVEATNAELVAALEEIEYQANSGEWTLPSSFANRARAAIAKTKVET